MLKAKEDVLNSFKSNIFPRFFDTAPHTTSRETSINEGYFIDEIKNDKENINSEIFNEYFGY